MVRTRVAAVLAAVLLIVCALAGMAAGAGAPPQLTRPVNDFAGVIDPASTRAIDERIRALQQASGDVVIVATVDTFAAVRGPPCSTPSRCSRTAARGIGERGRDNGLLVRAGRARPAGVGRGRLRPGTVHHRRLLRRDQPQRHGAGVPARRTTAWAWPRARRADRPHRRGARRHAAGRAAGDAAGAASPARPGWLVLALFVLFIVINALSAAARADGGAPERLDVAASGRSAADSGAAGSAAAASAAAAVGSVAGSAGSAAGAAAVAAAAEAGSARDASSGTRFVRRSMR